MLKISRYNILQKKTLVSVLLCTLLLIPCYVTAQESVELNGDTIEYSVEGNKVIAKGNVDIRYRGSLLTADEVEFDRDTQVAYAVGNVTLITDSGEISGEKIEFDFNSMTGSFNNAHIMAHPYYGYARKVHRVDDNHLVLEDGYITTSDYDKPGYRVVSKKIDVYPGDKLVAKHVKLKLAGIPVFYSPVYRHNISDQEPRFVFLPGYDSDWGAFLLSTFNHRFNDQVKIALHADYRNHLGTGGGADVFYNTDSFGDGLIRTYYTGEEDKNFVIPVKRDRYKVEWRHKWKIDDKTNAIWQFYKLSGPDFLKDYFEEEYDDDGNPGSFFVLTHAFSKGILSLR
ncbi:MAG: LPS-assembly protein, partial [Candidatus Omnitrophota bacterium]